MLISDKMREWDEDVARARRNGRAAHNALMALKFPDVLPAHNSTTFDAPPALALAEEPRER